MSKRTPAVLARDRRSASLAVAAFMVAGSLMIGALSILVPGYGGTGPVAITVNYAVVVTMGIVGLACWRMPERFPAAFWTAVPVLSLGTITLVTIATHDSSVGAQLFFLWPTLYAATFLPRRTVAVVVALVAPAEGAVMFILEPPLVAATNTVEMTIAVAMASIIIVALRTRVDRLLAVLERHAFTDQLTGLSNRRAFDQQLAEAAARAQRTGDELSVITIDVDRFKHINDTWGHPAGDAALQAIATALRAVARDSDVVARLGGDEFVAVVGSGSGGAHRLANALRAALRARSDLPGGPPKLSIGVASMPGDADDVASLLAASDAALYAAKVRQRGEGKTARLLGASRLRLRRRAPHPEPVRRALPRAARIARRSARRS